MRPTKIEYEYKYGDSITILPLTDIHYGATACDVGSLKKTLSKIKENVIILGLGDFFNAITPKDVKRYRKSEDSTYGDAILDEQVDGLASILRPYTDSIYALGIGNHEDDVIKYYGTNMIKRLIDSLNPEIVPRRIKYLGYSGLINLVLREDGKRVRSINIRYHHGWGGGGRTRGYSLTKYSKELSYYEADIYLYGHDHYKQDDRIPRLKITPGGNIQSRPKVLSVCGTYLNTCSDGDEVTYSEKRGYPPLEIGTPRIKIKPNEEWVDITVKS